MNAPSSPVNKIESESSGQHAAFCRLDLALCFTFVEIAEMNFTFGDSEIAGCATKKAEELCATARRLVADLKTSCSLTGQELQDATTKLERLREQLERLHRLRKAGDIRQDQRNRAAI